MLAQILALDVYRFSLVAARLGLVVMLIPGLGASYVLPQARLFLALAISFMVLPVVSPLLPPMPNTAIGLFLVIAGEATIGVFIGFILQLLLVSIHSAATSISYTSGIANAMIADPITEEQSAVVVGLLGNIAVMAIFTSGLYELIFRAAVDSYTLFTPGQPLLLGDFAKVALQTLDRSFLIGVKFSAPFLAASVVFQVGLGIIARLLPQMNAFFIGLPIQLLLGLALLMILTPPIIVAFINFFRDGIGGFITPG
ncbi:MAG: flagellar biosynthetic protein FliR [Alphaproteobacteria bacterium]|nr:flagellar biosynthetic protein FliR [Alphaproteobacteria bacterium]